jgi:hypothetical protein
VRVGLAVPLAVGLGLRVATALGDGAPPVLLGSTEPEKPAETVLIIAVHGAVKSPAVFVS